MKENLKITMRGFIYFSLIIGSCLGIGFSIVGGNVIKGLAFGLFGGFLSSVVMSIYLLIALTLFDKKLLLYSNMPTQLKKLGATNIHRQSVAGNATGKKIKYGGLFLTDSSIIFIPHRFSIRPLTIELPITEIKEVKKTGINLLKHFSGGLRKRLLIVTRAGHYEFSVWDIDQWIESLRAKIISRPSP